MYVCLYEHMYVWLYVFLSLYSYAIKVLHAVYFACLTADSWLSQLMRVLQSIFFVQLKFQHGICLLGQSFVSLIDAYVGTLSFYLIAILYYIS